MTTKLIFVLGDSRTGTLSLSNYFSACGIKSIHLFDKEANQLAHEPKNHEVNFQRIKEFVDTSGYRAFSDYPTRLYFRELAQTYPDALFIHTVRRDLQTWQRSMTTFFSQFNIVLDMEFKSDYYLLLNEQIREFFENHPQLSFLEICIDDGSVANSVLLKEFLGINTSLLLGWDNRTIDIQNNIPSGRCRLINIAGGENIASQIQQFRPEHKGILSEYGWVFLINDSNNFLSYMYGETQWSPDQAQRAVDVIAKRNSELEAMGTQYFKVIVPEKSVVYGEYLPKAMEVLTPSKNRPALTLAAAAPHSVIYLDEYLQDAKSYGALYFRGDSHNTWLGAYFVYQYTVKAVRNRLGERMGLPIPLSTLQPVLAGYDGDVRMQLAPSDVERLNDQWKDLQLAGIFEHCIQYSLPQDKRRARPGRVEGMLASLQFSRPMIVTEVDDDSLPTAVIFRDSTTDNFVDLLAEHFRRAVFIWYKGEVVRPIIESEQPDIVLHFMAERFVSAYGSTMVALSDMPLQGE